jgi:hypothetical protein
VSRGEPPPSRRGTRVARGLSRRSIRALVAAGAITTASIATSACGTQNGLALAKQACAYVNSSITTYESSLAIKDATTKAEVQQKAYNELQLALQPAALATTDNSQWQALMTTISESSRVPEGVLVSALQQQCAVANGGGNAPSPASGGTTPTTVPTT